MIDNSGIRVFYSPKQREFEAGILVTGHRRSPFMTIPPSQAEFNIYGICSAECMWNVSIHQKKDGNYINSILQRFDDFIFCQWIFPHIIGTEC